MAHGAARRGRGRLVVALAVSTLLVGATSAPSRAGQPTPPAMRNSSQIREASRPASAVSTARRLDAPRRNHVMVFGDSLTASGQRQLRDALSTAGWQLTVDARRGRAIASPEPVFDGAAQLADLLVGPFEPDAWIIELGTNDMKAVERCRCDDMRAFARARIRVVLDVIKSDGPVYWVGVQHFDHPRATQIFNEVLAELVGRGEIAGYVDWATMSAAHQRRWFVDAAHLSPAGYRVWIDAIVDALSPR